VIDCNNAWWKPEINVISTCIYTAYEQVIIGVIAPNPHLFYYFLWNIIFDLTPFWFTPTFSGTQLEHEIRANCTVLIILIHLIIMFSLQHRPTLWFVFSVCRMTLNMWSQEEMRTISLKWWESRECGHCTSSKDSNILGHLMS